MNVRYLIDVCAKETGRIEQRVARSVSVDVAIEFARRWAAGDIYSGGGAYFPRFVPLNFVPAVLVADPWRDKLLAGNALAVKLGGLPELRADLIHSANLGPERIDNRTHASEVLRQLHSATLSLRPVRFCYPIEIDGEILPACGFVRMLSSTCMVSQFGVCWNCLSGSQGCEHGADGFDISARVMQYRGLAP